MQGNKSIVNIVFVVLIFPFLVKGQDSIDRNWSVSGYISNMQSFIFRQVKDNWTIDNQVHNRLNVKWNNPSKTIRADLELRTRFISGQSISSNPDYLNEIDLDNGIVKLSSNLSKGKSYVLNSKIDRAYLEFTSSRFQIRIGRQRINWGQSLVWNPNDLFNAYSFFDFDYIEKPGSDAVRFQYYPGNTSTVDVTIKADNNRKITSAVLYRFNRWNYDFQLLGGLLNEKDLVLGTGWSGNILKASFTGEASYFHPRASFTDTTGTFLLSLGSQYSFRNSISLQIEALYYHSKAPGFNNVDNLLSTSLSVETLSFPGISLFAQCSYPISPLFNASIAGIYFQKIDGYFIGPDLTYSLSDNIDFSLIMQTFLGGKGTNQSSDINLAFLRLKLSF
jgi:hypothetical protein